MKRGLIAEIAKKTRVKENGLRVTLSRIKKRHDLRSTEQAACFYIKKHRLDINVSSIIDDVTRQAMQTVQAPRLVPLAIPPKANAKPRAVIAPRIKWMPTAYYSLAERLADFYGYLFIFENALRLKIHAVMNPKYANWWETRLKVDLPDVYKYANDEKLKQAKLPMVGQAGVLQPIDHVTVGHLEQIIVKYQSEFIPAVFPNLHFFTGHMVIVKRVRNAVAHMAPSTTATDIRNAKHEIDILLQHLSTI